VLFVGALFVLLFGEGVGIKKRGSEAPLFFRDAHCCNFPMKKQFEKYCRDLETTAITELFAWEIKQQSLIATIPEAERERLFPAVAVWGEKC
jgi:hypothetical protein